MNPILRQTALALFSTLRRYGPLPLAVFLAHELCAHVFDAYARWPAIDIPLHFLGGLAVAVFAQGAITLFSERHLLRPPDPLLRLLLLFTLSVTVAVAWEFAEWTSDRFLGTDCQMNDLDDTLLDLLLGLLGALAFLLPQLPAALRHYLHPPLPPRP